MSKKEYTYDYDYIAKHRPLWYTKDMIVVFTIAFMFGFFAGLVF